MTRRSTYKFLIAWAACLAICGCSKCDDTTPIDPTSDATICFGVQEVTETRIAPDATTFDQGDKIGVFGYFNWWYSSTSENVMLKNYALEIGSNTSLYNTGVKWSFSTFSSDRERQVFDVVAYYPYDADVHSTESDADPYIEFTSDGELIYTYTPEYDFMVATQRYSVWDSAYSSSYSDMREYLQDLEYIPLSFHRQMASVTLSITKDEDVDGSIIVTGATFYLLGDVPSKLTVPYGSYTAIADEDNLITPSDDGYVHSDISFTNKYSDDELTIGTDKVVLETDAFFPPGVEIFKVVLDISGTGAGEYTTHTWHPHLGELSINENYTLNIIIEPGRLN